MPRPYRVGFGIVGAARMCRGLLEVLAFLLVLMASAQLAGAITIDPAEAAARVGQDVEVEGIVRLAVCTPATCLLALEDSVVGFGILVPPAMPGGAADPRGAFSGRRIVVRGRVEDVDGHARIRVRSPEQIWLVEGGALAGAPVAAPAAPRVQRTESATRSRIVTASSEAHRTLDAGGSAGLAGRSSGVASNFGGADNMDALAERVARLEAAVVDLQARLVAASVPGAAQPVVGIAPAVRVRRGWSADRLRREAGDPLQIVPAGGGAASWVYPGGAIATLGRDGRVESAGGFR